MAEIEITLPTVQYGNVKVRATPEELGLESVDDATSLGIAAAVYLNLFTQGFKSGAQMDVSATLSASKDEVSRVVEETAKAAQILAGGLGGVTEVDDEAEDARTGGDYTKAPPWETDSKPVQSVSELISEERWQDTDHAPWDQKVAAQPKPWETGVTAPAVLDATW